FSPSGADLYYRSGCGRNGEACDLFRLPAAGLAPGGKPERLAEGVKSFEFVDRSGQRLLLGWSRRELVALDLATFEAGKLTAVDNAALPGSAVFLGQERKRLAYVVIDRKRAGVYVANLP